jgi:hypothetical protein
MSVIQKIFAYNTGSLISGTTQVGDIAVSEADVEYSANYGGLQWWGGPDETLGYVIAHSDPSRVPDYLGFWRSSGLTDSDFLNLCNSIPPRIGFPPFTNTNDAYTWLNSNGYWTSYVVSLCDSFTFIGNNANTTTTSAINTGGGGWDSSAYSTETYTTPVTLTFQTTDNGNYLMGGFSYNPTSIPTTYLNTTYGLYVQPGFLEIYENGGQVNVPGAMTTLSTDVWKVEYNGTDVRYYKNDVLIYISSNPVTQPLHVFFALLTPAEGVDNVCFTEQPAVTPTPTASPVAVTPTTTPTNTPTNTPTITPTISLTPTNTPTPSTTPIPVTGYGYNLVVLPYAPPTSGNTIFPRFTVTGETSGVTTPNTFNVNGVYWNAIDNLSVNRTSYYSGMTGTSVTAYFTQNGDTAIYSGSSTAFTFEGPPGQQAFNYNPGASPSQLVLIQSASTNFVTGQTVYISYVVN